MGIKNPLRERREKRGWTQERMAAFLGTVQSEVSKTEAGQMPPEPDVGRWAKAYGVSKKKFRADCEAALWALPLWSTVVKSPREIEHIDCRPERKLVPINDPEVEHARRIAQ